MKLIIQMPCYNEAEVLPAVTADLPRRVPGIDTVELLVIDDGSTDGTADVARRLGVNHVLCNTRNLGLARSFQRGLNACLALGADVIVNTDGDNQYAGHSVPDLVRPVVEGRADVVVGDRRAEEREDFSALKRRLQRLGSAVVRRLSGLDIPDAVSGFRAFSHEAALRTNVVTNFSYTTETLIQAGHKGLTVVSVAVDTNPNTRPSRLARSMFGFVLRQFTTIVRSYTMFSPLRAFGSLGLLMIFAGALPILRFLYFYATGDGDGHVQSLLLGSLLVALGYVTVVIALLSDTIATNRQLLESTLERVRKLELAAQRRDDAARPAEPGAAAAPMPARERCEPAQ